MKTYRKPKTMRGYVTTVFDPTNAIQFCLFDTTEDGLERQFRGITQARQPFRTDLVQRVQIVYNPQQ